MHLYARSAAAMWAGDSGFGEARVQGCEGSALGIVPLRIPAIMQTYIWDARQRTATRKLLVRALGVFATGFETTQNP